MNQTETGLSYVHATKRHRYIPTFSQLSPFHPSVQEQVLDALSVAKVHVPPFTHHFWLVQSFETSIDLEIIFKRASHVHKLLCVIQI